MPRILNDAGDTSNIPGYYKFNVDRSTADVGLRGLFATGPVTHMTTLMATRYEDELSRGINNGTTILSNIYHPVDTPKQSINAPKVLRISETELSGVALTDTLGFLDDRLQLTLGMRHQSIECHAAHQAGARRHFAKHAQLNATVALFGLHRIHAIGAHFAAGLGDLEQRHTDHEGAMFILHAGLSG